MKSLIALAALVALGSAVTRARAQDEDRIVLDDVRIKFLKPSDYRLAAPEEYRYPIRFLLRSPTSPRYTATKEENGVIMTRSIVGGIFLMTLPKKKTGLESDNTIPTITNPEMLGKVIPGLAVQNTAKIKIAGRDALAILASIDIQKQLGVQEEGTIRMLVMSTDKQILIWGFGAMSSEFSDRVKSFERMMATVKFLDDPVPAAKPSKPAKPKK